MALYLKYRPKDFHSLVWQNFIKQTLQKAVEEEKTVWAYLFTWPRGTGKTSTARIFAKAINCENVQWWNPCWECEICKSFSENSLIDIIEIDAASHTWVDNIREIIEKAQFSPTRTKYKIYIIDEVHMLSKGAFNALLKILEEPPKHVKFILATTEIHKVPDTILSRCQRYDFRNHTDQDVKERLEFIASEEWISVDEESYNFIIKSAEWGLRNAISLFEQLIKDNKIEYSHIVETLWVASEDEKINFIEKLFSKDFSILDDFEDILKSWKNLKNFFKDITQDIQKIAIKDLKSGLSIDTYINILDILQDILTKSKQSFDEVITFRIWILKLLWKDNNSLDPQKQSISKVNKDKLPTQSKTVEQKVEKTKPEELVADDVQDIFAGQNDTNSELEFNEPSPVSDSLFNSNKLIDEVKKLGWKAALTMSLKWSKFQINDSVLEIDSKTKIAYNTLDKTENRDLILNAAQSMWVQISSMQIS